MAEGVALMHSKGAIHRDIKPDNIMFRQRPVHGQILAPDALVIIDLGIAAERDRPAGAAVSRGWSDPVSVAARDNRKKIVAVTGFDIYSMGRVLRYMVTGEKPNSTTLDSALKASLPPETLRFNKRRTKDEQTQIAADLSRLIQDCLADTIDKRPPAGELVRRANRILDGLAARPQLFRSRMLVPVGLFLVTLFFGLLLSQRVPLLAPVSASVAPVATSVADLSDDFVATVNDTIMRLRDVGLPTPVTATPGVETQQAATVTPQAEGPATATSPVAQQNSAGAEEPTPTRAATPTPLPTPTLAAVETQLHYRANTNATQGNTDRNPHGNTNRNVDAGHRPPQRRHHHHQPQRYHRRLRCRKRPWPATSPSTSSTPILPTPVQ